MCLFQDVFTVLSKLFRAVHTGLCPGLYRRFVSIKQCLGLGKLALIQHVAQLHGQFGDGGHVAYPWNTRFSIGGDVDRRHGVFRLHLF